MLLISLRLLSFVAVASLIAFALLPEPPDVLLGSDYVRHAVGFFVASAVSAAAFKKVSLPTLWIIFGALGGAIELLQIAMGLGRVGEWSDWYVDLGATSLSLLIVFVMRIIFSRSESPQPPENEDQPIGPDEV